MSLSLMKFFKPKNRLLYAIVIFLTLFVGKTSYSQTNIPKPYIQQTNSGLVYDAFFYYKAHYVSGLLVMKNEARGYHIALLSKMGPTLMDFVLTEDGVIWNKTIEEIDNAIVLKEIEKDFRIFLLTPLNNPKKVKILKSGLIKVKKSIKLKLKPSEDGTRIVSAKTKGFINLFKTFVTFSYDDQDDIPDLLKLRHRIIKLKIELKQLAQ